MLTQISNRVDGSKRLEAFQYPMFKDQYDRLLKQAEQIKAQRPGDYKSHKTVKLLAKITDLIINEIPLNPGHSNYNLVNTLGSDYRHWRRDKFGRYRLFLRYRIRQRPDGSEDSTLSVLMRKSDMIKLSASIEPLT